MARRLLDRPDDEVVATAKLERQRRGPIARIALFLRQVMAELRKVVRPTLRETINYTAVVLAFVVVIMGVVYLLDLAFSALVIFAFGSPS